MATSPVAQPCKLPVGNTNITKSFTQLPSLADQDEGTLVGIAHCASPPVIGLQYFVSPVTRL